VRTSGVPEMLDNSSLVKMEHKKWALCVRLIGSSGQVTEVTSVVFLACVTGLSVVTMVTASRQLSGAPTCKGRSNVAGKSEIRCQEMSFPTREIISPKNVRSSAPAHRNVHQPCPRPNSLNNIGLKGPAQGAPRAGHGYISVEPGYLAYRGCTWSCADWCSLRALAERTHHKGFVLWKFPKLFKYARPSGVCSDGGKGLFECTPQLQLSMGPLHTALRAGAVGRSTGFCVSAQ